VVAAAVKKLPTKAPLLQPKKKQKKNQLKKQQSKNDRIGFYKGARLLTVLLFFALSVFPTL
jgi:hypothetical protein